MPPSQNPSSVPPFSNPQLAQIIARVESTDNISAYRFEPGIFAGDSVRNRNADIIERITRLNDCDIDSARVIFSSSYGLYQIMGFNIYASARADIGSVLDFWEDSALQGKLFFDFLTSHGINYTWSQLKSSPFLLAQFARVYNGYASRYSLAMKQAAQELGL